MNLAQMHTSIKNSISTGFNNNYLCGINLISVNFDFLKFLYSDQHERQNKNIVSTWG